MWKPLSLSVVWPQFVGMNAQDENQIITGVVTATQAGVITRRMALEKLRQVFPFENIDAVIEDLDGESKHKMNVEHMLAQAMKPETLPPEDDENENENDGEDTDESGAGEDA